MILCVLSKGWEKRGEGWGKGQDACGGLVGSASRKKMINREKEKTEMKGGKRRERQRRDWDRVKRSMKYG